MPRKPQAIDDALEELIDERDHIRIQMSLLGDGGLCRDNVLKPLSDKVRELDRLIETRQRSIHGQSIW